MKKVFLSLCFVIMLLLITGQEAFSFAPRPTLNLEVNNFRDKVCYLDLLSNERKVPYHLFESLYPGIYREMPIYKYYSDGWYAISVRASLIRYGDIRITNNGLTKVGQSFSLGSVPKVFKVIIQRESGELYVSKNTYNFTEFIQTTAIDFLNDMEKVDIQKYNIKIKGYVKPGIKASEGLKSVM